MEKKALGKGLGALIPQRERMKQVLLHEASEEFDQAQIHELPIEQIQPNKMQPREKFSSEKLQELVSSIKEKGVIQPLLVRKVENGYELIAGERRLRAAKELKLDTIPALVKSRIDDRTSLELALIENLQRDNLNSMEEAHAYQRLIDDFGFTQEQVAQSVGKARVSVTNTLRLLKLPVQIQEALEQDLLSMAHARTLLSIEDPKRQLEICNLVIAQKLSVRELENMVRKGVISKTKKTKPPVKKDMHLAALEEELKNILGTKVTISHGKKRGKVQIEYYSLDDLERLLNILRKTYEK